MQDGVLFGPTVFGETQFSKKYILPHKTKNGGGDIFKLGPCVLQVFGRIRDGFFPYLAFWDLGPKCCHCGGFVSACCRFWLVFHGAKQLRRV